MAHRRHLTDTYREGFCCVCGISSVNQFYGIYESYIDYCGNFHTLTEVLVDILNVNISTDDENTMEICQDCKDKLVKFYHFKRKAHEVQTQFKLFQPPIVKITTAINVLPQINHHTINDNYQDDLTHTSYEEEQNHEKSSSHEQFKIMSAVSLNSHNNEIVIKEEPEEPPDIVFADYSSDLSTPDYPTLSQSQKTRRQFRRRGDKNLPISKAAIKMRLYRERLKLPENRARFIQHQKQQREYNRRHYMRKQGVDLRRKSRVNYNEEYEEMFMLPDGGID